MKKTITVLTFPKKGALKKAEELEALANKDLYFGPETRAIVLSANGDFELYKSFKEARVAATTELNDALRTANAELIEHYVRGDRKISKKVQASMADWIRIKDSEYELPETAKEETTSETETDSDVVETETVEPTQVTDDKVKKSMRSLLESVFGENIPEGVGVHIMKEVDELKPVVGYETKDGGQKNLTVRDLQLLALLYSTTAELAKGGLGGITLNINGKVIGPDDAKLPFSIVEIEAFLQNYLKTKA